MEGQYFREFKEILIDTYFQELAQAEMIPSRRILKEDIPGRLKCLQYQGIKNLNDLIIAVKTPEKLRTFARTSGLPEEYLTILKREIGSIQPKPVNLEDFPAIAAEDIRILKGLGITHTKLLFDQVKTENDRKELSKKTGISADRILELAKLADVSRIKWVGANFARLLLDSGYDTAEKVANANYQDLYSAVLAINEKRKYFKGKFGLNDMKLCVLAARNVPKGIHIERCCRS